jgi:nitrogen fixation protein FixH
MSPTTLIARRPRGLQGRHVLGVFLAFFGTVFVVNGALIYEAVSTHTGLVANEPYRKGLAYNERISADERQARLGWTETLEVRRDGHVTLALAERDGRAVRGLKVEGVLGRPATNRYDIKLVLAETAPGRYEAQTAAVTEGSWLIALEARAQAGDESIYRTRRRLWLMP